MQNPTYTLSQISTEGSAVPIFGTDVSNLKAEVSYIGWDYRIRVVSKNESDSTPKWDTTTRHIIISHDQGSASGGFGTLGFGNTYYISRFRGNFLRCVIFDSRPDSSAKGSVSLLEAAGSWTAQEGGHHDFRDESAATGTVGKFFASGSYRFGDFGYGDSQTQKWLTRTDTREIIKDFTIEASNAPGRRYITIHADKAGIDKIKLDHEPRFDALGFGPLYAGIFDPGFAVIRTFHWGGKQSLEFFILCRPTPLVFYADLQP